MAETISEMDQRDIAASLNGDGEAYARLVQHYQDQVFGANVAVSLGIPPFWKSWCRKFLLRPT